MKTQHLDVARASARQRAPGILPGRAAVNCHSLRFCWTGSRQGAGGTLGLLLIAAILLLGSFAASRAADSARPATNAFRFVDLSPFASSAEGTVRQFSVLPAGLQSFDGIPFFMGARIAVTGIESAHYGEFFPPEVTGIKIGAAARRIHLLHAVMFAEKDGVPVAKIVFHYSKGGQESVRLGYGIHTRAWITPRRERRSELYDPNSRVAWAETDERRGSSLRIFQTALENPRPGEAIESIDVVSMFSSSAPLILAISVEGPESKRPANRPLPSRKPLRDMRELSDSAYRGEISVRVTDGQSAAPPKNARVVLSITDDKETFFFGETNLNAQGVCRMPYPPQHAAGLSVWVHAPGRAPAIISEWKTNKAKFSSEYVVALKPGITAGGLVKDAQGKPVAGAQVIIHKINRISPHHYGRVDYDVATTSTDGKWTTQSLPENLDGLSFQVMHADYRPTFYVTAGYAPPPTNTTSSTSITTSSSAVTYTRLPDGTLVPSNTRRVAAPRGSNVPLLTTNVLLAGNAEFTLQPALLLEGTLVDTGGKPVPSAEVIVQRQEDRKYLRTDAKGKFQTRMTDPGNAAVVVIREGFAPVFHNVNVTANVAPVEIKLAPPRIMRGRVQDRSQRPVAGARVKLDAWNGTTDLLSFQTLTDEKGTFIWTGAPSDQVTFYITKTNYYNARHSFSGPSDNLVISVNRAPGVYGKVYDVETKQPITSFTVIPGRKYSQGETQIHWERYEAQRARNGEYALKMDSYFFQPEARVLVEAIGYEPQISPAFNNPDSYTNDFALKKGKGVSGVVQLADGSPAPMATLTLVERGEYGYLDTGGQLRSSSSGGELVRADTSGRFEFPAKLNPDKIFVSHEQGFAQVAVSNVMQSGKIVLQKWGRVTGKMLVGDKVELEQTVRLQNNYERYYDSSVRAAMLSFYLKADLESDRSFVFEKVPPGEHRIAVEYHRENRNGGETPLSHGFPFVVKPGETTDVMLGGTGRQVTGQVKIGGGDQSDVDWKRDVHKLILTLPDPIAPPTNVNSLPPAERQKIWNDYNMRQREFWQSDAGRERQRAERMYVLLFETNGNFRAENVPPGKYTLALNFTDPDDEPYNRRTIGMLNKEVVVPDDRNAKVNAPFDIGTAEVPVRSRIKIGKQVPSFEAKTADGKMIKLSDYRGKPVLLHFWGLSLGYSTYDLQVLKQFQDSYGSAGRLAILGLNLDADTNNAAQFVKSQNMTWPQTYLGNWSQTPIPAMFGLQGNTACILVDAEGRLASNQLRGSSIRNAVVNMFANE